MNNTFIEYVQFAVLPIESRVQKDKIKDSYDKRIKDLHE